LTEHDKEQNVRPLRRIDLSAAAFAKVKLSLHCGHVSVIRLDALEHATEQYRRGRAGKDMIVTPHAAHFSRGDGSSVR